MKVLTVAGCNILFTGNAFTEYTLIKLYDTLDDRLHGFESLDINSSFPKTILLNCVSEEETNMIKEYLGDRVCHIDTYKGCPSSREFITTNPKSSRNELLKILGSRSHSAIYFDCDTREDLIKIMEDLRKLKFKFFYIDKIPIVR